MKKNKEEKIEKEEVIEETTETEVFGITEEELKESETIEEVDENVSSESK